MRLLEEGLLRPLTLGSAPAGFGKTTLLSAWVHALAEGLPKDTPQAVQYALLAHAWERATVLIEQTVTPLMPFPAPEEASDLPAEVVMGY